MYTASQLQQNINNYIAGLSLPATPGGLYDPIAYALKGGGKRIRPVLMLMAYNLYREDIQTVYAPAAAVEIYHNCTLLHDDLMDQSDKRRGKPTVHKVWNENTAILSGDAMLILAYRYLAQCPPDKLSQVLALFNQTVLEICEGQQYDMDFETQNRVTEAEYIRMIRLKTAVLPAAALKIGALCGGAPEADANQLYDFGLWLGLAFQMQDDLLDVYGDSVVFGKNIGGDILCNKKTYLLIKALEQADAAGRAALNHWLNVSAFDPSEKIAGVTGLYNQLGIKKLCEDQISSYYNRAGQALAAVTAAPDQIRELRILAETLMHRTL